MTTFTLTKNQVREIMSHICLGEKIMAIKRFIGFTKIDLNESDRIITRYCPTAYFVDPSVRENLAEQFYDDYFPQSIPEAIQSVLNKILDTSNETRIPRRDKILNEVLSSMFVILKDNLDDDQYSTLMHNWEK